MPTKDEHLKRLRKKFKKSDFLDPKKIKKILKDPDFQAYMRLAKKDWDKKLKAQRDAVRESQRITAKDLRTVINT